MAKIIDATISIQKIPIYEEVTRSQQQSVNNAPPIPVEIATYIIIIII